MSETKKNWKKLQRHFASLDAEDGVVLTLALVLHATVLGHSLLHFREGFLRGLSGKSKSLYIFFFIERVFCRWYLGHVDF